LNLIPCRPVYFQNKRYATASYLIIFQTPISSQTRFFNLFAEKQDANEQKVCIPYLLLLLLSFLFQNEP
jgi:hypothetical protein